MEHTWQGVEKEFAKLRSELKDALEEGFEGPQGPKGEPGEKGEKGEKGERGEQGPVRIQKELTPNNEKQASD